MAGSGGGRSGGRGGGGQEGHITFSGFKGSLIIIHPCISSQPQPDQQVPFLVHSIKGYLCIRIHSYEHPSFIPPYCWVSTMDSGLIWQGIQSCRTPLLYWTQTLVFILTQNRMTEAKMNFPASRLTRNLCPSLAVVCKLECASEWFTGSLKTQVLSPSQRAWFWKSGGAWEFGL